MKQEEERRKGKRRDNKDRKKSRRNGLPGRGEGLSNWAPRKQP